MRPWMPALVVLVVAPMPAAHAQTTTLDGVAAFTRGDFARAAEILQPIAEAWPPRDPLAEVIMAALYENGLGIAADPVRACALYVRASRDHSTPLARAADELLDGVRRSLGPAGFERCMLLVNAGFDHRFRPATFMLEPRHWISIDLDAATINYEGREKRVALALAFGGAVHLPVAHTELRFGPSLSVRRHFIEFFTWMPRESASWTLFWRVFEVVREELVDVGTAALVTVPGERPPDSFPVRDIARLRVHESGYAEWAVLSGQDQKGRLIPTDAERQEIAKRTEARKAAEAQVDWTKVGDVHRPPALTYADADNCRLVRVYGWSSDRMETITIRADGALPGRPQGPRTFDLASPPPGVEVLVHVYDRPMRSFPSCTDARVSGIPEQTWRAIGGTLTIELEGPVVRAHAPWAYRATIRIADMEVVGPTGARVRQPQPLTFTALVGSPVR